MSESLVPSASDDLVCELRALVGQTRSRVARALNSELVWLCWQVGCRLRRELLGDKRADYGQHVVETVAASLTAEFGRGFDRRSLYRMMRFAEVFPDAEIVAALRPQLNTYVSWYAACEMTEGDNPPVGLLLCTDKDHTVIKYTPAGMNNQLFGRSIRRLCPRRLRFRACWRGC